MKLPDQKIETFPDGVALIYKATRRGYSSLKGIVHFETLSVGVNRYYTAAIDDTQVDRLIKIPAVAFIAREDIAIIEGVQYWVKRIQLKPERNVYEVELQSIQTPLKEESST